MIANVSHPTIDVIRLAAVCGGLRQFDCKALELAYPADGPRPTDPDDAIDRAVCAWSKGKAPHLGQPDVLRRVKKRR